MTAATGVAGAGVALADPGIGDEEVAAVARVLRSGWISMGAETAVLEDELAAALGVDDAVVVSSGTAALHLTALALGLGPGDEVVIPSLTFVATAAAFLAVGARPVFADVVGPDDLTVDPKAVAAALTPRTRAVVAVHYGGWSAALGELRALTDAAGVALVEDAAHAPAVVGPDGMLGTVGELGCFSFHTTKNMTMGEGGLVVARDPGLLEHVRALRSHAVTAPGGSRRGGAHVPMDVGCLGLNYRPTDLGAAIGRVQLARLDRERAARRDLTGEYRRLLTSLPVDVPFAPEAPSAHHLLPVLLPAGADRDGVRAALRTAGVQTAVHYPPVHRFGAYAPYVTDAAAPARTEDASGRLLSLPLHGRLGGGDVARVVDALAGALTGGASDASAGADGTAAPLTRRHDDGR